MQDNTPATQADMKERLRLLLDRYGKSVYDSAYQKTHDAAVSRMVTVRVFKEMYQSMYAQTDKRSMDAWVQDITSRELADIALSELMAERAPVSAPDYMETGAEMAISPSVTAAAAAAAAVMTDGAAAGSAVMANETVAGSAESLPRRTGGTPGYDMAAHEREVEPKKRGRGMDWLWGIMLFLGTAVLLWAIAGLLMAQGILPQLDLGYSALGIF